MNFETTNTFDNQAKKLSKKYPQLKKDLINLQNIYDATIQKSELENIDDKIIVKILKEHGLA